MFSMGGFHILFQVYLIYIYRMNKIYLTEVVLLTKSYNLQDFKDWLHWHLDIVGFNHAHIFDNESSVDIKTVCEEYGDRVSYELIKGWPDQYNLYNRYINNESKAWWVLPIDDDEFLYVSDKYENNINTFLYTNTFIKDNNIHKLCIGWRNLFPSYFTEKRLNNNIILNATGWSNEACSIWQDGNEPVKTIVWLGQKYEWADKPGLHKTHNPFTVGKDEKSFTLNGEEILRCKQQNATKGTEDLIIYHYQYKSNEEWINKCKTRKSPGSKYFKKDYPDIFKKLYGSYKINEDLRMVELWNG